jgi:hypothetical protein
MKKHYMKRTLIISILLIAAAYVNAQTNQTNRIQSQQQNQTAVQTATLKNSSRLFATKDDLTSVITIIPADSTVTVLDSDSTYLHVQYADNEGYIFNRKVILKRAPAKIIQESQPQPSVQESQPVQEQRESRFSYLENKYGTSMAARLNSGKIWKGMNAEMVKDSWGTAEKINRVIDGNTVKEEWVFRNTWLYFENNTLLEWGPVKK